MKKLLSVLLTAVMLFSLTACGDAPDEQDDTSFEQDDTSVEQDNTSVEQDDTSAEQDETSAEQDETSVEQDETSAEQDDTSVEESVLIAEGLKNSKYCYNEYSDHIEIIKYLLDEPKVEIPSEINGKPVTVIGDFSFYIYAGSTRLTSVTIPDSVTKIEAGAFSCCAILKSVTIPDGVTEIGEDAFWACKNVTVTYKGTAYTYEQIENLYAAING